MTWIDIGVTLLLTLRMALSRPGLPRLLNKDEDARRPQEETKIPDAARGISQLHIHVMPDPEGTVTSSIFSQYNSFTKARIRAVAARRYISRLGGK
jgi:hypothetical protein